MTVKGRNNMKTIRLSHPSIFERVILFKNLFMKSEFTDVTLPQKLGNYLFHSRIEKDNPYKSFGTGIYVKSGKKYFVKIWKGRQKDFKYYSLMNEYFISKALNRRSLRRKNLFIYVPNVVEYFHTDEMFAVVFKYIEGKTLSKYPYSTQGKFLSKVLLNLGDLSKKILKEDRKNIKKTTAIDYILTFHAFIVLA